MDWVPKGQKTRNKSTTHTVKNLGSKEEKKKRKQTIAAGKEQWVWRRKDHNSTMKPTTHTAKTGKQKDTVRFKSFTSTEWQWQKKEKPQSKATTTTKKPTTVQQANTKKIWVKKGAKATQSKEKKTWRPVQKNEEIFFPPSTIKAYKSASGQHKWIPKHNLHYCGNGYAWVQK